MSERRESGLQYRREPLVKKLPISPKRYNLELSKSAPNVDPDVDESKAFHRVSSLDHTDKLAIARRQHGKSPGVPAGPPASPELLSTPTSKSAAKPGSWLRLFRAKKPPSKKG